MSTFGEGRIDWSGPSPTYLGGLLSNQLVIIRDIGIVAYVTNIAAYPEGLAFMVFVQDARDGHNLYGTTPVVTVSLPDGNNWSSDHRTRGNLLIETQAESGSGSDDFYWRCNYWLPDLPVSGEVAFTVSVGEIRGMKTIPGDFLARAASAAEELWIPPPPRWDR